MSCYYSHCSISFKHKYSTFCAFQVDPLCEFEESILPSQIFNSKGFNKTRTLTSVANLFPDEVSILKNWSNFTLTLTLSIFTFVI